MKKLKYLLVSEGPTDIALIRKLSKDIGLMLETDVEIIELSPQKDATTGSYPPHGWTEVKRWCKTWKVKNASDLQDVPKHFVEMLKRRNWRSLVLLQNANGLIIQMDTDIAEEINDLAVSFEQSSDSRRVYCQNAIHSWLGEDDNSLDKAFLLLPSYAMETWILARHDPEETIFDDLNKPFNYEDIKDVEDRLVSLGYSSKKKKNKKKLVKKPAVYEHYAELVFSTLDKVKERCAEADRYDSFLREQCQ